MIYIPKIKKTIYLVFKKLIIFKKNSLIKNILLNYLIKLFNIYLLYYII